MARVVLTGNLRHYTEGETELELDAHTVRHLFKLLSERHPLLGPHLETGIAVAIDGCLYQDAWLEPIPTDAEVYLLPQIAGG